MALELDKMTRLPGDEAFRRESIKGTQENADERSWEVPVPANGKTELTVTFLTPW